jgi:hypothetical protein
MPPRRPQTFQGASAAWGKLGAVIADVVFGYVSIQTTFYLSSAFGLFGGLITILFLPDTTGLSLDELDRMVSRAYLQIHLIPLSTARNRAPIAPACF